MRWVYVWPITAAVSNVDILLSAVYLTVDSVFILSVVVLMSSVVC